MVDRRLPCQTLTAAKGFAAPAPPTATANSRPHFNTGREGVGLYAPALSALAALELIRRGGGAKTASIFRACG